MSLFVVETPLQLVNAEEARQHFAVEQPHLLLLLSPPFPAAVFDPLLKRDSWSTVRTFTIRTRADEADWHTLDRDLPFYRFWRKLLRQINRRRRLENIVKAAGPVPRIFLGNYLGDYMRHVARIAVPGEVIVLDDGTDTLKANRERHEATPVGMREKLPAAPGFRSALRQQFVEWDSRHVPAVSFFSSYQLQVRSGDRLVPNSYRFLRQRMTSVEHVEMVFYLGQPLAADGYMHESAYIEALKAARAHFAGETVVYVAHPREPDAFASRVAAAAGMTMKRFDAPIEIVMVSGGIRPRALASFFCSALENCSVLFGSALSIKAFEIPDSELLCCHDDVRRIYDHLRSNQTGHLEVLTIG